MVVFLDREGILILSASSPYFARRAQTPKLGLVLRPATMFQMFSTNT